MIFKQISPIKLRAVKDDSKFSIHKMTKNNAQKFHRRDILN